MAQQSLSSRSTRRISLSVRVSLWLMCVAIIPLLIAVVYSELQARPALITQANTAMQSDAQTHVQLIDTYLNERKLDAETLSQVPTVQTFVATVPSATPAYQDLTRLTMYALGAGIFRDKHYAVWTLFNAQGHLLLSDPLPTDYPIQLQQRGQYLIPPAIQQAILANNTVYSGVYYRSTTNKIFMDIYAPIFNPQTKQFLGSMRATLNLDYILDIVNGDHGNGQGSYASVLDQNGVRIIDPNATHRFKAVSTLDTQTQQQIVQESLYGATAPVDAVQDSVLAGKRNDRAMQLTFQNQNFQVVQHTVSAVPWKYLVFSPSSTITAVADQQLIGTVLLAFIMLLLAAIIGLIVGRRITHPVMDSVEALRRSSLALTSLAVKQQDAASEQMWVVDSSQVGLQSIQYYTDATKIASHQLGDVGKTLTSNLRSVDVHTAQQHLGRIVSAAHYIESATEYQADSNQKLSTALKVATQVSEQLADGATSATEAANRLEQVVEQLRQVVGN